MQGSIGKTIVELRQGDITEEAVDAIVNAANNRLIMGGGVAGAIKRKGGKEIEEEAIAKGPIPVGEAVATGAGRLQAKYVIHAATMAMDLVTDEGKIRAATRNSLKRAEELKLASIAFPALGAGVGGFPLRQAARVMLEETKGHLEGTTTSIQRVVFVLYGAEAYQAFEEELKRALGV
jgi:O-acetyl-ADP-ribose deacetylase (regulator of RNase III)